MSDITTIKDTTANPAPLGLLAFGMTTVLLNIANAGLIPLTSMILAMGIFYGGLAQVIAGIMEWKKGNTFGCVAFLSYGMFWLAFVGLLVLPKMGLAAGPDAATVGYFLLLWGIFSLVMFIGTFKINLHLQIVFGTLTVLFFLLTAHEFTGVAAIGTIAGWEGIICGATAIYAGFSQVLGELNK
ncbi:MAG: acetate uptake transporter [Burkholderiaceae bacterium]|jgi:succinate-acetate transporter protein|nr:acetate uptake transporter [Burkholderiaceae bacterium]